MTIFGSNIREELTDMLAVHLRVEADKRFRASFNDDSPEISESQAWYDVAIDAMDFIYGEEPGSETPQTSEGDPEPGTEGCCGGPAGSGDRCTDPGDGTGVRDALTGVVDPPTSPHNWFGIRRGGISFPVRQSPTGEPVPGPGSGYASTAQSPQGPGSADE